MLVEDAGRFARDLMAQELSLGILIKLGMRVLTTSGDNLTVTDDHLEVAKRQIAGTFLANDRSCLGLDRAALATNCKAPNARKRAVEL